MDKFERDRKIALGATIISCIGVVISAINLIFTSRTGQPTGTAITLLCSNITIMCACISLANKKKRG